MIYKTHWVWIHTHWVWIHTHWVWIRTHWVWIHTRYESIPSDEMPIVISEHFQKKPNYPGCREYIY